MRGFVRKEARLINPVIYQRITIFGDFSEHCEALAAAIFALKDDMICVININITHIPIQFLIFGAVFFGIPDAVKSLDNSPAAFFDFIERRTIERDGEKYAVSIR